jgi:iron complex outermembrane receptor protein
MKAYLLSSAALIASVSVCGPAQAQAQAQPATGPVPSLSSQTQNPTSAGGQSPDVADADGPEVVVTGIRASIERAQEIKRFAPSVVEAVTFEDLGKFSDQNIADSLQRVPGVQIVRNDSGDTGDRASVRGLGSQYLQTTVNGRTLISVGNNGVSPNNLRSFNLDMVPTEVIGGLKLYKSPVAEIVEPGIAGELDISTLRPLDYKSTGSVFGSIAARGQIDDQAKALRPRFSGIVGAKLFGDTLGFFVSGIATTERSQTGTLTLGPYGKGSVFTAGPQGTVTETPNVLLTPGGEFYDNDFIRKRRTVSGGLEWKPDSHWNIYADFTYNKYSNDQVRQHQSLSSNGNALYGTATNPVRPGDVTIKDGVVTGFTTVRNGVPAARYNLDGPRVNRNDSDLKYGGLNIKWNDGPFEVSADYGHSDVKYFGQSITIYGQDIPANFTLDTSSGLPQFKVNQDLLSVPIRASFWSDNQRVLKSNRDSFRLDGKYSFAPDWAFKIGARAEQSKVDSRAGSTFTFLPNFNVQSGQANPNTTRSFGTQFPEQTFTAADVAALDKATYSGSTFSIFPNLGVPTLPAASFGGFCSVATVLCAQDIRTGSLYKGGFPTMGVPSAADATNPLLFSPNNSIYARERTVAVYGAIDGSAEAFGVPVDGNIGLRALHVALSSRAFGSVRNITYDGALQSQSLVPTQDSHKYWEYLPNLNLNAHPVSNVNLRFGVARSVTMPEYLDTAPSGILTIIDPTSRNYNPQLRPDFGTFGSTQLKPIAAWNYDLTFEYYTPFRGSVIASVFYKDISNFILQTTVNGVSVPGQTLKFQIQGPQNISSATAKGFEIGFNQPFSFLSSPFDGLGIQANYTYVTSKIKSSLVDAQYGIPGTSKHNANVVAYYEKYGIGLRLGYTYRSATLLATGAGLPLPLIQRAISNLDANLTYALTKNIDLTASAVNITRAKRRDYLGTPAALVNYYDRPIIYSFGARVSF